MDFEEAHEGLLSEEQKVRLVSARYFAVNARREDLDSLIVAAGKESVSWISRALNTAMKRARAYPIQPIDVEMDTVENNDNPSVEEGAQLAYLKAVEEVTGTILHEFSPFIGRLKLNAKKEIVNYNSSNCKSIITQLSSLVDAIKDLKKSVATPRYTEFDLNQMVITVLELFQQEYSKIVFTLGGAKPFLVHADRNLMLLAFTNGIRNACESICRHSISDPPEITINWGKAGNDNYLAVFDSCTGFVGNPSDALKMGTTNKANHIGYGLATASNSILSMEGEVKVSNSQSGGAVFELRWFRDRNENTNS
jgi:signal transduction histidine kinase